MQTSPDGLVAGFLEKPDLDRVHRSLPARPRCPAPAPPCPPMPGCTWLDSRPAAAGRAQPRDDPARPAAPGLGPATCCPGWSGADLPVRGRPHRPARRPRQHPRLSRHPRRRARRPLPPDEPGHGRTDQHRPAVLDPRVQLCAPRTA
ncbi:hypothetical protein ACRAWF_02120 [Streptomyces sp. L7]